MRSPAPPPDIGKLPAGSRCPRQGQPHLKGSLCPPERLRLQTVRPAEASELACWDKSRGGHPARPLQSAARDKFYSFQSLRGARITFRASCNVRAGTVSKPLLGVASSRNRFGTTTRLKPSLAASCKRCSICETARSSPERPSSPIRAISAGMALSLIEEAMAAATARSAAGS